MASSRWQKSFSKAFLLFSQHICILGGESIGRKSAPIQLIVHYPKAEEGRQELARRVASVHADAVTRKLLKLTCPDRQKRQLLDAVIQAAREEVMSQSP